MRRRETGGSTPRARVISVALGAALVVLALFVPPPVDAQSAAFTLSSDNSTPRGITYANTRYYVVDATDDSVYAYDSDGNRASTYDFDLSSGNSDPTGIVYGGSRFHVLDYADDVVYKYTSAGNNATGDFSLASANVKPVGITYYNSKLYVVDVGSDYVYVYTTSGSRQASLEFSLDTQNSDPSGIAYNGNVFYVTDRVDSRVYAYSTSGTYLSSIAVNASTVHGAVWQSGLKVVISASVDRVKEYPLPGSPADVTVTVADGQLTASWNAPVSGGTVGGYRVRYYNTATLSYSSITDVAASTSHTFTGLTNLTRYQFYVWAYYFAWQGAAASGSATPTPGLCDSAVDLGTLAVAGDSELSNSGELPAAAADLACVDADTRGSAYFTFIIGTDDAGAVKIVSAQGLSAMRPELLLRSGSGAYSGDPLFQDTRADVEDALAAGLVSAGTYTLQLRSTVAVDSGQTGIGGAYSVKVTRLQPEPTGLSGFGDRMLTAWKVGLPVSDDTLNTIALPIKIEYKETKDAAWTVEQASISPENGQQSFVEEVTGLNVGGTYHVRAA